MAQVHNNKSKHRLLLANEQIRAALVLHFSVTSRSPFVFIFFHTGRWKKSSRRTHNQTDTEPFIVMPIIQFLFIVLWFVYYCLDWNPFIHLCHWIAFVVQHFENGRCSPNKALEHKKWTNIERNGIPCAAGPHSVYVRACVRYCWAISRLQRHPVSKQIVQTRIGLIHRFFSFFAVLPCSAT